MRTLRTFHDRKDQIIDKNAGGPCEPAAKFATRLLPFVVLHYRVDLLLYCLEIE
jgi:hypothetical protein